MATRVQIAFDLSATAGVNFFTLDDTDKGVLDNTAYLLGGDVLIDVTQYVRDFSVKRGRSTTLQKFTAGQANVTLDNRSRIFDPTYAPTTVTRTNLVTNPSFEVDTAGWSASGSTISRQLTQSKFGSASQRVVSSTLGGGAFCTIPVTAGVTYFVSGYIYLETAGSLRFDIYGVWKNSAGATIAGEEGSGGNAEKVISAGEWIRFYTPVTAPVGAASFDLYFRQLNYGDPTSKTWYLDAVLLETGSTLLPYFDGTTSDSSITRILSQGWTGTANASTSTISYYETGTGGPYFGQILPRKQIVIDRDSETIYTGLIEDWNFNYDVSGQSLAEVSASDGFTLVANQTRTAGTATSQLTGARVAAVLTEIGWPLTRRNISVGQATLDADVVAADENALNYLQKVETSEPGALFIGKAGDFTFRDRADLQTYTSGLTFGGTGIPFTGMGVVFGVEELLNVSSVTFTAAGVIAGTAIATDAASQTAYGTIDETIDTLLASSADAGGLAAYRVGTLSQPKYRIDAITISLEGCTAAQVLQVLDVELGDVATVTWTPNSIGSAISQIVTVDQIEHSAAPDRHDVTFTMSETIAAFILDDAIYGVLDDDILGF